jgi:hypothetical protein
VQIIALLVVIWALIVATLAAVIVAALIVGGMLSTYPRARAFVPLFLIVIPATAIGALFGGLAVGILSVRVDDALVLLGPLFGLILGGAAGLAVGLVLALVQWRRMATDTGRTQTASPAVPTEALRNHH